MIDFHSGKVTLTLKQFGPLDGLCSLPVYPLNEIPRSVLQSAPSEDGEGVAQRPVLPTTFVQTSHGQTETNL